MDDRDSGLQPERTVLSWWRTALAVTAGAAVVLRFTAADGPRAMVVAAVLVATALVTLVAAALRGRELRRRRPAAPSSWLVRSLATATATAGVAVLVLLLG